MAYQQVQFEFPDPDKAAAADKGVKEKANGDFEITIEGRADPLKEDKPAKPERAEKEESDLDIEVIDAQVALTQAKTDHLNAVFGLEIAKAKLNKAVGVEVL